MPRPRGAIAAGHPATVAAAEAVLRDGGNAFDAVVAGHFTACIAEPVLCSLGGGGFLMARPAGQAPRVYDFFAQTPRRRRDEGVDFHPVVADFGTARQEFHIGLGAAATPGCVAGLFRVQADLCHLPMTRLVEPALELARDGIELNDFQAYLFRIVAPIYLATPAARAIYGDPAAPRQILRQGQRLRQPDQADFVEVLAREGKDLFYRGEVAQAIDRLCRDGGGHLQYADLEHYRIELRAPLQLAYREARVFTNPPPASGGLLIAFALDLLEAIELAPVPFGSARYLDLLTTVMRLTREARLATRLDDSLHPDPAQLLNPDFVQQYRNRIQARARSQRGTTQLSVIDGDGNLASMTVSNGEGCGHIIPDTGVMLNNMLGEEDINPGGFGHWPPDQRMTSMMAPTAVLFADGREIALGSGGSNRIRSAILQVLINLIDYAMPVEAAVIAPRLHLEGKTLSLEAGFEARQLEGLLADYPDHTLWPERNLFFGGAHTVQFRGKHFEACGDPRRGGAAVILA